MTNFEIFQQAQKNLDKNPQSEMDQFIVDLWNASKNLHTKNVALSADLEAAKTERSAADLRAADYARRLDIAESALTKRTPSLPDPGSWLRNLIATASTVKPE